MAASFAVDELIFLHISCHKVKASAAGHPKAALRGDVCRLAILEATFGGGPKSADNACRPARPTATRTGLGI